MSQRFEIVKKWYEEGRWTKEMVKNAVGRWITQKEYEDIVKEGDV